MSGDSDRTKPANDGGEPEGPLSVEQFETLVQEAAGHPDRVSALVRRLVLQTIEEVRQSLDEPNDPS